MNSFVEYFNGVLGRLLVVILDKGDLRIWERGSVDFLTGYWGLRYSFISKSLYQLFMRRSMRLFWKFYVMFRLMISDDVSGAELE